jgi:FkbM family methyltransferase
MVPKVASGPGKGLRFDAGSGVNQCASGEYERPVQEAIVAIAHPGDVFYDVGANLGFFSVLVGRLVGTSGAVYAFEPVPANASMVERNARQNGLSNIKVLRIALCREDGMGELLLTHYVGGAVLKSVGTPPLDLSGSVMVETACLDRLVDRQHIKPPNIVKIDVEGAEMDVLLGMESILRRWHPKIVLELDDETEAGCEDKVSACQSFLHNLGYQTELLANAYPNTSWYVRHFIAVLR